MGEIVKSVELDTGHILELWHLDSGYFRIKREDYDWYKICTGDYNLASESFDSIAQAFNEGYNY